MNLDPREIPIGQTIVLAYGAVARSYTVFLLLMSAPFLISTLLFLLLLVLDGAVTELIPFLIPLVWVPPITAWHRLIILGERPGSFREYYSIGMPEWSFAWCATLLLGVVTIVVFLSFVLVDQLIHQFPIPFPNLEEDDIGATIVMFAIAYLGYVAVCRFLLVLPASAIGNPISFKSSWVLSKGNGLRLWVVYVVAALPGSIGRDLISRSSMSPGPGANKLELILFLPLKWAPELLFFMVVVGALSFSYIHLTRETNS